MIYLETMGETGYPPTQFYITKQEYEELKNDLNSMMRYNNEGRYTGPGINRLIFNGVPVYIVADNKKKSRLPEWF